MDFDESVDWNAALKFLHDGASAVRREQEDPEEVVAHRYVEDMCDYCGSDMDTAVMSPQDREDVDVYMYDCDDCENSGMYIGGKEDAQPHYQMKAISDDPLIEGSLSDMVDVGDYTTVTLWRGEDYRKSPDSEPLAEIDFGTYREIPVEAVLHRIAHNPFVSIPEELEQELEEQLENPDLVIAVEDPTGYGEIEEPDLTEILDNGHVELGQLD